MNFLPSVLSAVWSALRRTGSRRGARLLGAAVLALAAAVPAHAASLVFNGSAAAGCTFDGTSTYSCATLPTTSDITIASGYTVNLTSSMNFDFNQQLNMSGTAKLTSTGDLNIGNVKPSNLNITGGTLVAGGTFSIGAQAQTITANISATTMSIGTGSTTQITGSLTASGEIDLSSHVTIIGPVSGSVITTNSPVSVTGNVTASTSFSLASGSSVSGNVSGGALTLSPSSASITGNVNLTGDVDIGSGDNITGNLVAHNVTTESSNAYISGNASVNAITLGYGGRVGKTITCTGSGAAGCSCVTNNSGYNSGANAPVCSAAPPSSLDHILITHNGQGLTCQPTPVTLTACADNACTSQYGNSVTVTLTPGGQSFTFTGSTSNATVQQLTAGSTNLAVSAGAAHNSCVNSAIPGSTSCSMYFSTSGLALGVNNHVADTAQALTISALTQNPVTGGAPSCVPLFRNTSKSINFTCAYSNPSSGTLPLTIGGAALNAAGNASAACDTTGKNISIAFDGNGSATLSGSAGLNYSDVGAMALNATYTDSSGGASNGQKVTGATAFSVAPAQFLISVVQKNGGKVNPAPADATGAAFIKAGELFVTTVSALSAKNKVTPNFGKEASPEGVDLSDTQVVPSSSVPTANRDFPALGGKLGSFVNGVTDTNSTDGQMSWNAVGIINLLATLHNPNGYLGLGSAYITKGNVNVGRFIPDHYATALGSVPLACPSISNTSLYGVLCPAPNASGKFIYSKQPFDVSVTAYNGDGSVAKNVDTAYGLSRAVSLSAWSAAGGSSANPPATPAGSTIKWAATGTTSSIPASGFTQGVGVPGTTSSGAADLPEYDFIAATPPTNIFLRASDTDGATSLLVAPLVSAETGLTVLSGRLQVSNNYGSSSSPMTVKATAQYWNSSSYVNNVLFTLSPGPTLDLTATTGNVVFSNCTKSLPAAGKTCQTSFALSGSAAFPFTAGVAYMRLAPTKLDGTVDISINALPYLPPLGVTGRETFGVYRAGPVLYQREVY